MRLVLLLAVLSILSLAAVVPLSGTERPEELFKQFTEKFGKKYTSEEEYNYRFAVFLYNLKEIERLNARNDGVTCIKAITFLFF